MSGTPPGEGDAPPEGAPSFPWFAFRDDWIRYRDAHIVVVDKPPGMPTQRYRPEVPDDLPSRLREHLARGGQPVALGVHQRLDQATSGLIVYSLSPEAKRALGRSFERRAVHKEYVAAVVGRAPEGELVDGLRRARRGGVEVVPRGTRGAKDAVSEVHERARRGDRALLGVRIATGRTHQIRAQLAHHGAPVGGDALYGGAPAPRLLLHARRLAFAHPVGGAPMEFVSEPPSCFEDWLEGRPGWPRGEELDERLRWAAQRRHGLRGAGEGERTTAFRWVHGAADGLPGVALEVFGEHVVVHVRGATDGDVAELLERLERGGVQGAYVKRHPKRASGLSPSERAALAPPEPAFGRAAPAPHVVYERGLALGVELGAGLGVGLFLDQRGNRQRIRDAAPGRACLNLFAHTCSFTVAAAVGGAESTLSVDASGAALARGRANLALNGLDTEGHRFVKEDAFVFLERLRRRGQRFGLVIVDPPTYSTTKARRWKSGAGWVDLAEACFAVCEPGAIVLATSNDTRMGLGRFRDHLRAGAERAQVPLAQMRDLPTARDFPRAGGAQPVAKSVWITLADRTYGPRH